MGSGSFSSGNEGNEPAHIHVEKQEGYAKFWLAPVRLANSKAFNAATLNKLLLSVRQNEALFLEKWSEYFARQ